MAAEAQMELAAVYVPHCVERSHLGPAASHPAEYMKYSDRLSHYATPMSLFAINMKQTSPGLMSSIQGIAGPSDADSPILPGARNTSGCSHPQPGRPNTEINRTSVRLSCGDSWSYVNSTRRDGRFCPNLFTD